MSDAPNERAVEILARHQWSNDPVAGGREPNEHELASAMIWARGDLTALIRAGYTQLREEPNDGR